MNNARSQDLSVKIVQIVHFRPVLGHDRKSIVSVARSPDHLPRNMTRQPMSVIDALTHGYDVLHGTTKVHHCTLIHICPQFDLRNRTCAIQRPLGHSVNVGLHSPLLAGLRRVRIVDRDTVHPEPSGPSSRETMYNRSVIKDVSQCSGSAQRNENWVSVDDDLLCRA